MRKRVGPKAPIILSLSRTGHPVRLSDLERGKLNPTVVTLDELAEALGVSHGELVRPD